MSNVSKIVYWMSAFVDGFVETRDGKIDFTAPSEELFRFCNDLARDLGAFLHGRRTYEVMASYWPTADADPSAPETIADFARIWRAKPKVVFSKTLRHVEHNNRLAGDDPSAEIARLRREVDGDLGVSGAGLGSSLLSLSLGLVDELRMFVCPVILGGGKPYFPPLDHSLKLELVETRTFPGGVVLLRYARA